MCYEGFQTGIFAFQACQVGGQAYQAFAVAQAFGFEVGVAVGQSAQACQERFVAGRGVGTCGVCAGACGGMCAGVFYA